MGMSTAGTTARIVSKNVLFNLKLSSIPCYGCLAAPKAFLLSGRRESFRYPHRLSSLPLFHEAVSTDLCGNRLEGPAKFAGTACHSDGNSCGKIAADHPGRTNRSSFPALTRVLHRRCREQQASAPAPLPRNDQPPLFQCPQDPPDSCANAINHPGFKSQGLLVKETCAGAGDVGLPRWRRRIRPFEIQWIMVTVLSAPLTTPARLPVAA